MKKITVTLQNIDEIVESVKKSIEVSKAFSGFYAHCPHHNTWHFFEKETPQNRIFLLDFDYFLLIPNTVDFDKVDEWLNTAHKNLETTFEEVLTDKAKLMFDK